MTLINGVTREVNSDNASRWAIFEAEGFPFCSVSQPVNLADLTMSRVRVYYRANFGSGDLESAEQMAEALRQTIELAREWEADAGKPYRDVLK